MTTGTGCSQEGRILLASRLADYLRCLGEDATNPDLTVLARLTLVRDRVERTREIEQELAARKKQSQGEAAMIDKVDGSEPTRFLLLRGLRGAPRRMRLSVQGAEDCWTAMMVGEDDPPSPPGSLQGGCFFGKRPAEARESPRWTRRIEASAPAAEVVSSAVEEGRQCSWQ